MEPPSPLISGVNLFLSRFTNRTIFFCNVLESHECACCLLSLLYFHWLFPLSARETASGRLQGLLWEMEIPSDWLLLLLVYFKANVLHFFSLSGDIK